MCYNATDRVALLPDLRPSPVPHDRWGSFLFAGWAAAKVCASVVVHGGERQVRGNLSTNKGLVDDAVIPTPLAQGLTFRYGLSAE
jgi:hypothetical protein